MYHNINMQSIQVNNLVPHGLEFKCAFFPLLTKLLLIWYAYMCTLKKKKRIKKYLGKVDCKSKIPLPLQKTLKKTSIN